MRVGRDPDAGRDADGPRISDRYGRRVLILPGMLLQAVGLVAFATLPSFADRVPASDRATALGVYRFFRDGGYALGAIVATLSLGGISGVIAGVGVALGLATFAVRKEV